MAHAPLQGTSPRTNRRRVRAMPPTDVEGRPRNGEPATLLSFPALQRLRNRGSAHRGDRCPRHVPASTFPTSSPAYSPRDLSGMFQPVTLLGFGLQGFPPREGLATLSSRRSSPAVHRAPTTLRPPERGSAPEFDLPRVRAPCAAVLPATPGRYPHGLFPSKALPPTVVEPASRLLPLVHFARLAP